MKQLQEFVLALCEDFDSARALSVAILVRHDRWLDAQRLQPFAPTDFLSADAYFDNHQPGELLRKLQLPGEVKRLHAEAVRTFLLLEQENARTNLRIRRFLPDSLFLEAPEDVMLWKFFRCVRQKIGSLLGKLPNSLTPRFSGGATVGDVGKLTTIPDKMSGTAQIYAGSSDELPFWWRSSWGRVCMNRPPRIVRSNRFFSVPKDSLKNRGCAKEASINISLQLSAAQELRRRLLHWGIDFETGQMVHSELARKASRDGTLATIDLSNASDTLAKSVVKLFLPEEWFMLLNSLRAPLTRVDGKTYYLEKFSSMGNGFTFELETLIFAALARALPEYEDGDTVKVFGDDIIVSTHLARPLMAVLRFCGFTMNRRKTFVDGPFRESCGGDFFDGQDVRPIYLGVPPNHPHEWIALANQVRTLRTRTARVTVGTWKMCLAALPSNVRSLRGPISLGDLVIHDDEKHWRPRTEQHDGYKVRFFRTWHPVAKLLPWTRWRPDVQLSCVTLCDSEGVGFRGNVTGYTHRWVQEPPDGVQWLPQS